MEQETNKPQKALDIFTGMVIMHGTDGDKGNWNSILDYINNIEADLYEVNCRIEDQLSIINDLEADLLSVYMKGIVDSNKLWRQTIQEKIEELESKIKATFCKYMTEEDYYNNKFLSSDVAEDYEVLEVRKLISNRNLLQELMEDK